MTFIKANVSVLKLDTSNIPKKGFPAKKNMTFKAKELETPPSTSIAKPLTNDKTEDGEQHTFFQTVTGGTVRLFSFMPG
ncbi:hypothetical protein ABEO83_17280 [Bacillus glycinifermentans]|uniref:hypothetical protein n=1 Tax=Bacillus glycinifermentans TaxID=1664069 RepID=UPI003D1E5950